MPSHCMNGFIWAGFQFLAVAPPTVEILNFDWIYLRTCNENQSTKLQWTEIREKIREKNIDISTLQIVSTFNAMHQKIKRPGYFFFFRLSNQAV